MITILGGKDKSGKKEKVKKIELKFGQIVSIVGPTGSGKTQLINDINCRADRNTSSDRKVIFKGSLGIAFVSQHNSFLTDYSVNKFLEIHAEIRGKKNMIQRAISFANELTGEKITGTESMTELSGGQTRSLMIADALVISDSPIVLLDEIENAGINKGRVLEVLKKNKKILVFVTHDPRIILSSDLRIVMKGGSMEQVIKTTGTEKKEYKQIEKVDEYINILRDKLRNGSQII